MPDNIFEHTYEMQPREVVEMLMNMAEAAIANIPDPETRAKAIRSYCVAMNDIAFGLGAGMADGMTAEDIVEEHVRQMTEDIADIRPMYDLFKKVKNASNN